MKKETILGLTLCLSAVSGADPGRGSRKMLEFDTMVAVVEPFTGPVNPIRGLNGGGLPWEIEAAKGKLGEDGKLEVEVRGLVLARRAPVPPERQGINPSPLFRAIVSCRTIMLGVPMIQNVLTGTFPATVTGDSQIEETLSLPSPCFAPIIFVTNPGGAWFAVTGR